MNKIAEICSQRCFGIDQYHGSCCKLENRDWIIGPVTDTHEVLQRLSKQFDRPVDYADVFIDFEEGSRLFPGRSTWQNPGAYPAMRVNVDSVDRACVFYNNIIKGCSIHPIRPALCQGFKCDYLKNQTENFAA